MKSRKKALRRQRTSSPGAKDGAPERSDTSRRLPIDRDSIPPAARGSLPFPKDARTALTVDILGVLRYHAFHGQVPKLLT